MTKGGLGALLEYEGAALAVGWMRLLTADVIEAGVHSGDKRPALTSPCAAPARAPTTGSISHAAAKQIGHTALSAVTAALIAIFVFTEGGHEPAGTIKFVVMFRALQLRPCAAMGACLDQEIGDGGYQLSDREWL